ncbi:unnamed protein product [Owenia fusiformis]|uniref:Uncharacterized protein n=1 Tax=Owenia fusiformis TaxID=6347 RepID=A0A8J1XJZ4_OWEFU|nr:unnamed protein product [Owenia fusiformis]
MQTARAVFLLVAVLAIISETKAGCPGGFSLFAGHCYLYGKDPELTWFEASALCVSQGAYLVNIGSSNEQHYIERSIRNTAMKNFWIGANSIGKNQQYWTKGNAVAGGYTNWQHGQPSKYHKGNLEPCTLIWGDNGDRWNDVQCFQRYFYICEHDNA